MASRRSPEIHEGTRELWQAPAVDPDVAMDGEWMQEYRQQTDEYWQQRREG